MSAIHLEWNPVNQQLESLRALVWLLRIRELYCLNRERLRHAPGTSERAVAESTLRQQVASMAAQRDSELAVKNLREPCRKILESLTDHWTGLTLFVDSEELLWERCGMVRTPGHDAVFDSCDTVTLEDQPAKLAELVLRSVCKLWRQSASRCGRVLTLEFVTRSTVRIAESAR